MCNVSPFCFSDMTRPDSLCDRDMISSPDDTVARSSTEAHVVQSPRDRSVADHHTPDPEVGTESPVQQDEMNAKPSAQISMYTIDLIILKLLTVR